jgi:hypothetical protein
MTARVEWQLEDAGVDKGFRGAVDLLLEVVENLLRRVLLRCPVPSPGCGLVAVLRWSLVLRVLVLVLGWVEVADKEDPGPSGLGLKIREELTDDAGFDLHVPAALGLDDDGERLGGAIPGVGRLDLHVGPASVDAGWPDLHFAVDDQLVSGEVLAQERADEVGQGVFPGRPPARLSLFLFPVP